MNEVKEGLAQGVKDGTETRPDTELITYLPPEPTLPASKPPTPSLPPKRQFFSKVREAREALAGKSKEVLDLYLTVIQEARKDGNYEVALTNLRWLLEHLPGDEEGVKVLAESVDKAKVVEKGHSGPQINIGFALGGLASGEQVSQKKLKTGRKVLEGEVVKNG